MSPVDPQQATPEGEPVTDSQRLAAAGRGCFGSLVSGGCGCFAFLVGAVAAVALFAPQLMGGWGARLLERELGRRIDGSVEVGDVHLSWEEPQRAGLVRVRDRDGDPVLEGSLRFPSLLELLGRGGAERRFVVDIERLSTRIDADGSSTLGRTFGVDAGGGRTVARALGDWALRQLDAVRTGSVDSSIDVRVEVREARIDDRAAGRGSVTLRGLSASLNASLSGLQLWVEGATAQHDAAGPEVAAARLSGSASFGTPAPGPPRADGASAVVAAAGPDQLLQVSLDGEGLTVDLLRTLGLLPRTDPPQRPADPRMRRDAFDLLGPAVGGLGGELVGRIDRIHLELGAPPQAEGEAVVAETDPRVALDLAGPAGRLTLGATLRRGRGPGGAHLLEAGPDGGLSFSMDAGPVATWLGGVSGGGVAVAPLDLGAGAGEPLRGRLEAFTLPVDRGLLELHSAPGPGSPRSFGEEVARSLRRGSGVLLLAGRVGVVLAPEALAAPGPYDVVELVHATTRVAFDRGHGEFESHWNTRSWGGQVSSVFGDLPTGAPEGGLYTLDVRGVPLSLVTGVFPLHPSAEALLERRIARVTLRDLDADRLVGGEIRSGGTRVELVTQEGERLAGTVGPEGVSIPAARFDLPLDGATIDHALRATMPWFEDFRPLEPDASLDVELVDFVIPAGAGDIGLRGLVRLTPPPLEVLLAPELLRDLKVENDRGWVRWAPGTLEMRLDGAGASYEGVAFPLGGGASCAMRGWSRRDGYSLSGQVEARYLRNLDRQGAADDGRLVQIDISNAAGGRPRVLVSASEVFDVLESIVDLLSPERRNRLLEKLMRGR